MRETVRKVIDYFPGRPSFAGPLEIRYKKQVGSALVNQLIDFIESTARRMEGIGIGGGVVVGLSGGLDSVTTAILCKSALGEAKLNCVIVDVDKSETEFAARASKKLGMNYQIVHAEKFLSEVRKVISGNGPFTGINLETRVIQTIIFGIADDLEAMVAATTDKSELILGRHTEYFYGHFAPLIGFYKTEVMDLAKLLGVPKSIYSRRPGCKNWWWDDEVLGVGYDIVDPLLYLITQEGMSVDAISRRYKIDPTWLHKIESRVRNQPLRLTSVNFPNHG